MKHFQFRSKYPRGFPPKINTQNSAPVVFRTFEDWVITQKMVNRIQLQQRQRDVRELRPTLLVFRVKLIPVFSEKNYVINFENEAGRFRITCWFDSGLTLKMLTWLPSKQLGVTVICVSPWYVYPRTHITSNMCIPSNMAAPPSPPNCLGCTK